MYLAKDIIKEGNPILRKLSTNVPLPLNPDDYACAKGLFEYMVASEIEELTEKYQIRPGVGIAAPQVGINKRMFAINCTDFLDKKKTKYAFVFINPIITSKSKEMVYLPGGEGCLSVERDTKDLVTPRHLRITVKSAILDFATNKIKTITMTLWGYPAIVFQHEYDHLDGILYTDKMYPLDKIECEPLYTIDETEDTEEE